VRARRRKKSVFLSINERPRGRKKAISATWLL